MCQKSFVCCKNYMQFKLLFKKSLDWGFLCYVPSLPWCVVHGDTIDEATAMALDVIPSCVEVFEEEGINIQDDSFMFETQVTIPYNRLRTDLINVYA